MAEPHAAPAPATAARSLEAAHRALTMHRRDLQFDLPGYTPRKPSPAAALAKPPWPNFSAICLGGWARPCRCCSGSLVIAAVLALIYLIAREVGWLTWVNKGKPPRLAPTDYHPRADVARALLDDADKLGRPGPRLCRSRPHMLLLRSIRGYAQVFVPKTQSKLAATSRDIAPTSMSCRPKPGPPLASMAQRVEMSLFGARPVDARGYEQARADYEAFAFPTVWT